MRRAANVVLAVLTVLTGFPTLVRLVGDHEVMPFVLVTCTVPYLVIPLVLLLVAHAVLRHKALSAGTAVLLVLNAWWFVPLYVADAPGKGTALTVMTANLRYGEGDPFTIVRLVQSEHVDLLATQELTTAEVDNLRGAGLLNDLPYFTGTPDPKDGPDGSGLWSRYPITAQKEWPTRFSSPGAVVHAPSGDLLVRVAHAAPPVAVERGTYKRDVSVLKEQVAALPTSLPTILLGDFNATVDNSLIRDLEGSRFHDAGELAGSGWVRTWSQHPGSRPLLGLDHVLVDKRFGVRSTSVRDVPRSDHRALVARLVLRT